jgi:LysM repeat protein
MQFGNRAVAVLAVLLFAAGITILLLAGRDSASSPAPQETTASTEAELPTQPATPLPLPSASPLPLIHTIREGDTLAAIATIYGIALDDLIEANELTDPNLIHAGQELIIPGRVAPTSEIPPSPTPLLPTPPPAPVLPTSTPSGPPQVEIAGVLGAGNLGQELVRVRNLGGAAVLEDWTLSSSPDTSFTFPRLVLFGQGETTVYSGAGQSTPTNLYWGRSQPAWESGALVVLRDPWDAVVDTYVVP